MNYLMHLVGQSMTYAEFDKIIYTIVTATNQFIPLNAKMQISAVIDAAMSSLMRVYNPQLLEDPTLMSDKPFEYNIIFGKNDNSMRSRYSVSNDG